MKKLLVIGKNWPEPNTTAAGYRMLQLLRIFQEDAYQIHFSCAATKSEFSEDLKSLQITEKFSTILVLMIMSKNCNQISSCTIVL
jgi:hypothetical protein